MTALRFVTSNPLKLAEAKSILEPCGIDVVGFDHKIDELQTDDALKLKCQLSDAACKLSRRAAAAS